MYKNTNLKNNNQTLSTIYEDKELENITTEPENITTEPENITTEPENITIESEKENNEHITKNRKI